MADRFDDLLGKPDSYNKIRKINREYHNIIADIYEEDILTAHIFEKTAQGRSDGAIGFIAQKTTQNFPYR